MFATITLREGYYLAKRIGFERRSAFVTSCGWK